MPNNNATTIPETGLVGIFQRFIAAKKAEVIRMPITKNSRTAMACSAVFATSATLKPNIRMMSIIESIPKVTNGPGRTRAIQSNRANGTNGRSIRLSSRYMIPTSGAVNRPPVSAPDANPRLPMNLSG